VVVVKAVRAGSFSIAGLPTGIYGIKYTTGDGTSEPIEYDVDLTDAVINEGDSLNTMIPGSGVLTVYAKLSPPVPVELSAFSANVEGQDVILTWVTQSELNNFGFEVQRSEDGVMFGKIAFIQGNGTTSIPKEYTFVDEKLNFGEYYYRLKQVDLDGGSEFSEIIEAIIEIPKDYVLYQNYPNPFNPETTIGYRLPFEAVVTLKIYDITGREIKALLDNNLYPPGVYTISWKGRSDFEKPVASGVYFYSIRLQKSRESKTFFVQTRKMLLLK